MVWFFEHKGRFRRCEVHPEATHYRLVVGYSDGTERTEEYAHFEDLMRRTKRLEQEWTREGWQGPFSRDLR